MRTEVTVSSSAKRSDVLLSATTAQEVVREVLNLKDEVCIKIIIFLWKWWDVRNKINAGERLQASAQVIRAVYVCLGEQKKDTVMQSSGVTSKERGMESLPLRTNAKSILMLRTSGRRSQVHGALSLGTMKVKACWPVLADWSQCIMP